MIIAIAVACKPDVIIADEPTTALDVTIQAQILDLLRDIQKEKHAGVILITHDLGVVAETADRVAVMYAGQIVEVGSTKQIFENPKHPYTRSLLRSMPQADSENDDLYVIDGMVPSLKNMPQDADLRPAFHGFRHQNMKKILSCMKLNQDTKYVVRAIRISNFRTKSRWMNNE